MTWTPSFPCLAVVRDDANGGPIPSGVTAPTVAAQRRPSIRSDKEGRTMFKLEPIEWLVVILFAVVIVVLVVVGL
jgi:hypothetical protein